MNRKKFGMAEPKRLRKAGIHGVKVERTERRKNILDFNPLRISDVLAKIRKYLY